MNLKLKTLSLFAVLFLFSIAHAQTPPAGKKDGDLRFEPFNIRYGDDGQNVAGELGRAIVEYLRGGDVSKTKIALPPLKFIAIPNSKK